MRCDFDLFGCDNKCNKHSRIFVAIIWEFKKMTQHANALSKKWFKMLKDVTLDFLALNVFTTTQAMVFIFESSHLYMCEISLTWKYLQEFSKSVWDSFDHWCKMKLFLSPSRQHHKIFKNVSRYMLRRWQHSNGLIETAPFLQYFLCFYTDHRSQEFVFSQK